MILAGSALVLVLAIVGVGVWQQRRYLRVRREVLSDRQPQLYSGRVFHTFTLVKAPPGREPIDALRMLRDAIEVPGGGRVVYAGQVGMALVLSKQIPNDWNGLVLVQYPSRSAYDELAASADHRACLARFEAAYTQGVLRPAFMNLAVVQGLLLVRLRDILRRTASAFPFVPAGADALPRQQALIEQIPKLDALRPLSEDGVVIFNLIKPGNAEQRSADRAYTLRMMSGMAEGGYGPMHMGRALALEGDAEFSTFAAIYYPGIDFLQKMIGSTFMTRIGGGKQLGDSLAVVTVPVLARL